MKKSVLLNKERPAADTLSELARQWQPLADALSHPLYILDRDCAVVLANRAAAEFTATAGDLKKTRCFQLLHNSDRNIENCPALKTLATGESSETEIYEPHLNRYLLMQTSPVLSEGQVIGVVHSFFDITERKRSEQGSSEIIDIYAHSINEMKAREIRAQKGRDAFLNMLEDVNDSYRELEDLFLKLVLVMVNALDAKSPWTKGHSERVSYYAELIAKQLSIDEDDIKGIRLAGLLHDIGKIGTYDYLLDKPGRLTKEEFDIVKKHPDQGAAILKDIKQLVEVIPLIQYHHEKLDGNGYPHRLQGDQIPLGARILHVADSFDSMTSDRPYRPAPGLDFALSELAKFKGTQFDHEVVEAFLNALRTSPEWGAKMPQE